MTTIHSCTLEFETSKEINFPVSSIILYAESCGNKILIWFQCSQYEKQTKRKIYLIRHGQAFKSLQLRFINATKENQYLPMLFIYEELL